MPTTTENTALTRFWYGHPTDPNYMSYVDYFKRSSSRTTPAPRKRPADAVFSPTGYSHTRTLQSYGRVISSGGFYWDLNSPRASSSASQHVMPPFGVDLRNKIKSQKINLAQFILEYGQARRLAVDLTNRLVSIKRRWRSIKPGDILDTLGGTKYRGRQDLHIRDGVPSKVLSSNHLAFQYGVRPLMIDLEGLLEETRDRITSASFRQRLSIKHTDVRDNKTFVDLGIRSADVEDFSVAQYTHVCWYEVDRLSLSQQAARFGFLNFASLAWELTPWSFVADYLFKVGSIINSLDALVGVGRMTITTTTRTRSTTVYKPRKGTPSFRFVQNTTRVPTPLPSLVTDIKKIWQPNLTFVRTLNLVALLRTSVPPATRLWRI